MHRTIEQDLVQRKQRQNRKPLIIRGARQVGKSFIVEKFGKEHFDKLLVINFELMPKFKGCFEQLEPLKIVDAIELLSKESISIGKTLLFLDEIQLCPRALLSLRYFKEKLPELHVIAAGSLLEFILNDDIYQQPVGRVESMYMKPCSFKEFLNASGHEKLLHYLSDIDLNSKIDSPVHELLLEKIRDYFICGGMPEVVDYYTTQNKLHGCERIHASILEYYRRDFLKYGKKINPNVLEALYLKVPGMIAKHFKYADIDPDTPARDQKPALKALLDAGIIYKVNHSSASGLPFQVGMNPKKFKLLFLDIGIRRSNDLGY